MLPNRVLLMILSETYSKYISINLYIDQFVPYLNNKIFISLVVFNTSSIFLQDSLKRYINSIHIIKKTLLTINTNKNSNENS
jgi:hypothetical protein